MSFSLSRALAWLPIERAAFSITGFGPGGGFTYPASPQQTFLHYVLEGEVRLLHSAIADARLSAGDFACLPGGDRHAIGGGAATSFPATSLLKDLRPAEEPARIDATHGEPPSGCVLSASIDLRHSTGQHSKAPLPDVIVLQVGAGRYPSYPPPDMLCDALRGIGASALAASWMHGLFIQAVRASLADSSLAEPANLDVMHVPKVASVQRLMERRMEVDWTVGKLAEVAGMARSTFVMKFTAATGEPPLARLTRIRLAHADRLLNGLRPVSEIANMVGYGSHASFSRAFYRQFGETPTQRRRRYRV